MNQTDWIPQEEVLNNVLDVLKDSFIPDSEVQKTVQAKLCLLQNNTDLFNYFLLIFENNESFDTSTRALAGLILKNNVTYMHESTPMHIIDNIKGKCLKLLTDQSKDIRTSASALVIVLALKGKIENWPEVLPYLINLLDSTDSDICDTIIKTLVNICEDYLSQRFYAYITINESIKLLLNKFIELTTSNSTGVSKYSFKILNDSLHKFYSIIKDDFDSAKYLQQLMGSANDPREEIIILICQGFVTYINNKDECIIPSINDVITYMLMKTSDANEDIALQACEFWFSLSKLPTCKDILGVHLKDLVPVLLNNMKYAQLELCVLKDTIGCDQDMQDRSEDCRPFAKNTDQDEEDPEIGWTLRKCSAASLDALSLQFQDDITPIIMPLIMNNLESNDLLLKESGILALGAIGEGCFNSLIKILPSLMPPLINCMDDPHSLIRSITCWTLSRYTRFIVYNPQEDQFFVPVLMILLEHSLDENKRVQRAAISSFCFFQEEAKTKLIPYIDLISKAFLKGFEVYKMRSLYLLYDAITVLAQSIGHAFKKVHNLLMMPLVAKLNAIDDYNNAEEFLAICECLAAVVTAIDVEFIPFTEMVYHKCCHVVTETVNSSSQYEYSEEFDKDLISGALDLLVAMACHLKNYFVKYVINSNLMDQIFYVIQDESIQVRQPGLALLGEIVKLCYPYISNQIHVYIPAIIENLDKRFNGACNNAAWVIGKLCIAMEAGINPYAGQIIEHCMEILQTSDGLQTMYKTVAISLCTLALVCPDELSIHFKTLLKPVCSTIRNVADCEEKELAFRGLCELVVRNPDVFANDFIFFCDAVASFNTINYELKERIRNILITFRQAVGEENWETVYSNFPVLLKNRMNTLYGV